MPFIFKRSHHRDTGFRRSFVDAVKSIYTSDRRVSVTDAERPYDPSNAVKTRSARAIGRAQPHRITRLPHELLAHVFVLGAEADIMFPITVSHVCSIWRALALHTPALWRRITLDARLHMWAQRISRARACALDIQLIPPAQSSHLNYYNLAQVCMHFAAPHIHHWRSLEIKFTHCTPFLWNAALSGCCGRTGAVEAPSLRELSLVYPDNDDTKEFTLFNGHAPRLRRATLHGIRLAWLPSLFQNLTFLDYTHHGFTHGHAAASEVLYMLLVSTRLEELRIAFPWKGDPLSRRASPPPIGTVHLPRLRKLTLSVDGPDVPPALIHVLPHLSLPALGSLRLLASARRRTQAAFPRLRHVLRALPRLPPLAHLHLAHAWLEPRFLAALIAGLPPPGVRHLSLEGPLVTHAFLLDVLCGTAQPRVLELVGCDYVSAEMLVGIVRASQAPRARAGQKATSGLAVLHVRECVGVDWVLLWPLLVAGMEVRMWVRGSEVDFRARRPEVRYGH